MKIIFHEKYYQVYTYDPAASAGRMEAIYQEIKDFEIVEAIPAQDEDILLVHTEGHLKRVKSNGLVYPIALLAAGGAIISSEFAFDNEPAFALIRPPGHHASPDSCWGFCYFNNIAIAIQKLISERKIERAAIIDFDLHYGDGTDNFFRGSKHVIYHHGEGQTNTKFVNDIAKFLRRISDVDIIGVSAGFDRHEADWGGLLKTEDYRTIGTIIKEFTDKNCFGRRFAVLEGGYNHDVLGVNVRAFIEGFQ
ncbi:MAG: histone deacetylase family protein [Candidatus Hodarchaeota archaeon]